MNKIYDSLIRLGIFFILIGFALVFLGAILQAKNSEFGGLIMIGPIPVAFGSSPMITLAAMIIGLIILIFLWRRNA